LIKTLAPDRSADTALFRSEELIPYALNRLHMDMCLVWVEALRPHGLTVPRWQVLAILSLFDGSRIGLIAEMSGNEQPQTSRIIDQMVRDRLVERRPASEDSRAVGVWLTAKGRALYARLLPEAHEQVAHLFRNFTRAEKDVLLKFLKRLMRDVRPEAGGTPDLKP